MSSTNKEKFIEAVVGLKELSKVYLNKKVVKFLTAFILKTKNNSTVKNITHPELIASFEMLADLAMSARELLSDLPTSNIQEEDLIQLKKYHDSIFHLLAQSETILDHLNKKDNNEEEIISITTEEQEVKQSPLPNNLYKILSEDDMNNTITNFLKKK